MTIYDYAEWFEIPFAPDYLVNRSGVIKSKTRTVAGGVHKSIVRRGRIIKQANHKGYMRVSLSTDGKSKGYLVHRIIAIVFIDNPEKLGFVNHINGNKSDNRIENLEWCTHRQNMYHAKISGLMRPPRLKGNKNSNSILSEAQVLEIRKLYKNGMSQRDIARIYPVKRGTIWSIVHRKTWNHI